MNRKAFTLIELIVSIAIIAMLSTIVVKYVSKSLMEAKEKALDTMIKSIEMSAEEYVTNNEGVVTDYATNDWVKISIETLIENDYFSNSLTNPQTKEDIPISDIVYVRRDNNGKVDSTYDIDQNNKTTITLNGAYNVYVKKGGTYTEKGVTAETSEGINVTSQVVKTGTVDVNTIGTYVVTYTYQDVSITRNVIVVTTDMITERLWYALTVNPNGGTYNGSTANKIYSLKEGGNQTIANPTRTNYDFTGWSLTCTSCLSGGIYTMGTAADTLTANWDLAYVTLLVNLNGGSTTQTFNSSYPKNSTLTLTTPTKNGSIFIGWSVSGTGSSVNGSTLTIGTATITLTANWLPFSSMFTYTGSYTIVDDGSSNWRIKFLTSGTFTPLINMTIDLFLVGGGGGGGTGATYNGVGGAGGGYTKTQLNISLTVNTPYSIVVGNGGTAQVSGGASTGFGYSASGGVGVTSGAGSAGGSGGGSGTNANGDGKAGGSNGSNGTAGNYAAGTGQGTTTREFGESTGDLYSGGGGGGAYNNPAHTYYGGAGGSGGGGAGGNNLSSQTGKPGTANTGGGGGGGAGGKYTGGTGGTGIVIIRNHR